MFGWLFSRPIKKEVKDHLHSLHNQLTNSFSNIKHDISNIHTHLQNKDKRLAEVEEKIQLLENKLIYLLQPKKRLKQSENLVYDENEEDTDKSRIIDLNLANLTFTQKLLLKNIHELKTKYNQDLISSKSLAKYIYPGRGYDSVRTTLSEYLNILLEQGLIKKERIGRRMIITLTKDGEELSKEITKKEKTKRKQKIRVFDDL